MPTTRKIILKQHQSPGDILTFTRALADFKKTYPHWLIDVRSPASQIFDNSPHLTPLNETDPEVEIISATYDDINISGWSGIHFSDAFRNDIERALNTPEKVKEWGEVKIKKTGIMPELFISDEEKAWYNQVHCTFNWDGPYWLINAGRKPDNELKQYHAWPAVCDGLNDFFKGKVKIVQIGHPDHIHPNLQGVFDLKGKTDLRQLIRLAYWSEGTIGPLSFQFVLAAAFRKPAVCVAGGKEGVKWHLYPHIRHLYTNGCLPCCSYDGCWKGGKKGDCLDLVDGVPHCFRLITLESIVNAVKMYYEGGMLSMPEEEMWYTESKDEG